MKILLCLLLLCGTAFAKDHEWQDGKLMNVSRQSDGTAIGTSSASMAMAFSQSHAIFVVQVADIIYTVRGERVNQHTKDYSKGLVIGDSVKAAVEGNKLTLLLQDGKNLDTAILTRERAHSQSQ